MNSRNARTRATIAAAVVMNAERLNYWIDILSFPRAGHNDASREALLIHEIARTAKPIALRIAASEVLSDKVMGAPIRHDLCILREKPDVPHDVWGIEGLFLEVKPAFEDTEAAINTIKMSDARTCAVAAEMVEGMEGFPASSSKIYEDASSAEIILAHQALHDHIEEIKANAASLARELVFTVFHML